MKKYFAAAFGVFFWWAGASASYALTPMEQVKEEIDQTMGVLQDGQETQREAGNYFERREVLRQTFHSLFDFTEMAKRSLGPHWLRNDLRQKEFVAAFTDFLETIYINKIEALKGEKIVYLRERVDKNFAQVDTKVMPDWGDDLSIDYRLHLVGSKWKVYDVLIDNVSLVDSYRSQFKRVLTSNSFDDLLTRIREKTQNVKAE